ncbi:MAG: hypothetical protein MUO78_03735 [candidate division Zixibacteria bacterium]|nr:hypothetical protein [candidate division Zixibacteria bacterium]
MIIPGYLRFLGFPGVSGIITDKLTFYGFFGFFAFKDTKMKPAESGWMFLVLDQGLNAQNGLWKLGCATFYRSF